MIFLIAWTSSRQASSIIVLTQKSSLFWLTSFEQSSRTPHLNRSDSLMELLSNGLHPLLLLASDKSTLHLSKILLVTRPRSDHDILKDMTKPPMTTQKPSYCSRLRLDLAQIPQSSTSLSLCIRHYCHHPSSMTSTKSNKTSSPLSRSMLCTPRRLPSSWTLEPAVTTPQI